MLKKLLKNSCLILPFFLLTINFCKAAPPDTLKYFDGSYKALKREALRLKQPYILLFGASWCAPCKTLKNEVLSDNAIAYFANGRYLIKYIDLESFEGLEVNNEQKVSQLPTMRFFDMNGKFLEDVVGLVEVNLLYKKMRIHSGIPISRVYEQSTNDTLFEEKNK